MNAKNVWLFGRAFGVQAVLVVAGGLFWAVAGPTVGPKRLRGGAVVPSQPGEVRHVFESFALLVGVEFVVGAAAAFLVWLISRPVRGVALIGTVLAGAFVGALLAAPVGGAARSLVYPGPGQGPGSVGQAAVRLSGSEIHVAVTACLLGAAVVLFLAASATPTLGSRSGLERRRPQDRELVGDSQFAFGEPVHRGWAPAGLDTAASRHEHAAAPEHASEVGGVHRTL